MSWSVHRWMPLGAALLVVPALGCPPEPREALDAQCPDNSQWDGLRCVRTDVDCPAGSTWSSGKCLANGASGDDALVGAFTVTGARPDGVAYSGNAAVTKQGDVYHFLWSIAGTSYEGVGLRRADVLSVGWSLDSDHGVVDYVAKGDGTLDGTWTDAPSGMASGKTGREVLTGGLPNLAGVYSIASASTPEGASYSGSCDLAVTGALHTLLWHVGNETFRGLGIRRGDVLSVGFSTAQSGNFGVVQYVIAGGRLDGRWAEWSQKTPSLGSETLIKK